MNTSDSESDSHPDFSVVIGLVSTEDSDRILETLDQLRAQSSSHSYEVVIGDRRNDSVSDRIRDGYPEVTLVSASASATLPELRTRALEVCQGRFVIVTEDHCVPRSDWFQSFHDAFVTAPPDTVAVGGCVENGVTDRPLDWATFLCEYSFFLPPVDEGLTTVLPGMNVAYRRSALLDVPRDRLTQGFWETTVHPLFVQQGMKLYSSNRIRLLHSKKFSFRLFCRQRFVYSRYFAGIRFDRSQLIHRAAAFALTPILPALLLWRMVRQVRGKEQAGRHLKTAFPALVCFVVIWALGELAGYALGPGKALAEIE